MSRKFLQNIAASVKARLLHKSKQENRPFQELVQYYAMQRFLYRLSQSPHSKCFILKGGLTLRAWNASLSRPTMDIDMLGKISIKETSIVSKMLDVISVDVTSDGLLFFPESITSEPIMKETKYRGIRIQFQAKLDTMRLNMHLDIGFDDVIFPKAKMIEFPTILDFPAFYLLCYSRESVIAEKFETMIKLRELNSRMKDFFDIWLLSRNFDFDGGQLAEAIRLTFEQRGTKFPTEIVAFSQEFISAKQIQWKSFRRKLKQTHLPQTFEQIVITIENFISPIVVSLSHQIPFFRKWTSPGPWK